VRFDDFSSSLKSPYVAMISSMHDDHITFEKQPNSTTRLLFLSFLPQLSTLSHSSVISVFFS
jgi:hypothetical protein